MRFDQYFFGLSLGSLLLACSSTATTTTTIVRPELVSVEPDDFLGTLHCGSGPGEVQSYVATLFDVTPPTDGGPPPSPGLQLASSGPTSCDFPVTFSFVIVDHYYRAQIDGYDRAPKRDANDLDVTHISPVAPGGPLQVDGAGALVPPRWIALCGGYPMSDLDAGNATTGNTDADAGNADAGNADAGDAGNADAGDSGSTDAGNANVSGLDASIPGVISFDTLTQTVHDCGSGLRPVSPSQ